jgi:hypothetical protein
MTCCEPTATTPPPHATPHKESTASFPGVTRSVICHGEEAVAVVVNPCAVHKRRSRRPGPATGNGPTSR